MTIRTRTHLLVLIGCAVLLNLGVLLLGVNV